MLDEKSYKVEGALTPAAEGTSKFTLEAEEPIQEMGP